MNNAATPYPVGRHRLRGRELLSALGRRSLAIPLIAASWLLMLVTLPLLLAIVLVIDAFTHTHFSRSRGILMLLVYLSMELWGILALFYVWLVSGVWAGADHRRFLDRTFRLQNQWGHTLFAAARRFYSLDLEIEGEHALADGPMILFIRHASMIDTLLPVTLVSRERGIVLRYVLKRELLWDPCVDIAANRLPNHFTRRGSADSEREIESVQALARDLGPRGGVSIFPEGTRFSPAKRESVIERLSRSDDPTLAERAGALENLLPPRLGGTLGLLEVNDGADAVFLIHSGFEGAARAGDLWRGSLVRRKIRVNCWRVPFAEIPVERRDRIDWIYEQWTRADRWLD